LCILLAGDIATNPGPACNSTGIRFQNSQLKSLVLNARGLKRISREEVSNQTVCNLQRFQNLVYNENSDIICVNETWLNNSISNEDILPSGFTIYRKDREDRYGAGVLVAIKTDSFKSVKEFSPNGEEFEDL
jgi:exonuclease III